MKKNGRKALFISATHGNEKFSANVLKKIEKRYPRDVFGYDWIIGNPKAFSKGIRYVQADLNRSAPGDPSSIIYEEQRAAQILELSARYQFMIDIHGTVSSSGIVTIIPYPSLTNLLLAAMLPIERNIIWYAKSSLERGSLVQFAKCPGIEIECGPKSSKVIESELEDILGILLETKVDCSLEQLTHNLKRKDFYYVYDKQLENKERYTDFILANLGDEEFYPFLANQYPGIACYKMKKVNIEKFFLI